MLLDGKPILQWVWEIASRACEQSPDCHAVVATEPPKEGSQGGDSRTITDFCEARGIPVVITPEECKSGSDRAWHACLKLNARPDIIVNLQGDNPACMPSFITSVINAFGEHPESRVVTPYIQMRWRALELMRNKKMSFERRRWRELLGEPPGALHEKLRDMEKDAAPFSGTTVIVDKTGHAKWFSKNIIPALRGEDALRKNDPVFSPVTRHLGLYAFRYEALEFFVNAAAGKYEKLEQLEQLRFLENDIPIRMVGVGYPEEWDAIASGIDEPGDLRQTEMVFKKHGGPV